MKKVLFAVLLLFARGLCHAQKYECLQNGVTHYFVNGNGYLRGIKIDSVKTYPDSVVWYPYRTSRGQYSWGGSSLSMTADIAGGCWLGKKVTQLPDGTFLFDNYWTDSVAIIRTQANTGDRWVFYRDTGSLHYEATVTATDTMTILSAVDSVKKIVITARNASGIVTGDSLNNFTIWLSKNNGMVQGFDVYMFPYHKPDSAWQRGLDFFMDRALEPCNDVNSFPYFRPGPYAGIFHLTDFFIPNDQQLTSWNTGDVIETGHIFHLGETTREDNQLTITDKIVSGHTITYPMTCIRHNADGYTAYTDTMTASDDHYTIGSYFRFPEQYANNGYYTFYFPDDSSYCHRSPLYYIVPARFFAGGLGGEVRYWNYKTGMGQVFYKIETGDPYLMQDELTAYNSNGQQCGKFTFTDAVKNINEPVNNVRLYPDPAVNSLHISAAAAMDHILISDIAGRIVYRQENTGREVKIDISALAPGVYIIKIDNAAVQRFVKQ